MKRGSMLIGFALLAASMAPVQAASDLCLQRSDALLDSLQAHDYAAARSHFDARMQAAMDADKLGHVWANTLTSQFGAFERAAKPHLIPPHQGFSLVLTPLHFANGWLQMRVACSNDGQITGLFFVPGSAPPVETPGSANHEASGRNPQARNLSGSTPFGPLPGTLLIPSGTGPFPAVVIIAGSGPADRDGTLGPNKPLRDIAEGLYQNGIASYRYDKRTRVYGAQMLGKPITIDNVVTDDAVTALHLLAKQPHVDVRRLFVLGHSLGAMMAPRIAARVPAVDGLILMAPPAKMSFDTILRQIRYIGKVEGKSAHWINRQTAPIVAARDALAGVDIANPPPGIFFHAPASYWLSLRDYNAIFTASKLIQPMLILQGGSDYQVTPKDDFSAWQKAFAGNPRVTLRAFSGLSHLFMPAGNPPSPADYSKAGHVDPAVIRTISAWIDKIAKTQAG